VLGDSEKDAARLAKQYVTEAIRTARAMGRGLGPVNHLWPLREE
jgi:hydroxymethylpyrimidine/phosphomethylpyrimidine kinase